MRQAIIIIAYIYNGIFFICLVSHPFDLRLRQEDVTTRCEYRGERIDFVIFSMMSVYS